MAVSSIPAGNVASESRAQAGVRMLVVSSDLYPPTRVDVSVLFGEELAKRGHRVDWILQSEKQCDASYVQEWGGGKVWVGKTDLRPSLANRILKHFRSVAHDFKLFSVLRDGDYQIIEVKDKFLSGIFAVFAARRYKKKFVYWLSYPFPEDYLYRSQQPGRWRLLYRIRGLVFKYLLYGFLLPRADHVFVQSEQMKKDVAAEGIEPSRMTAVPMGVRVVPGSTLPAHTVRTKIPEGVRCFLYLGTMAQVRRIDFLIRVLAIVLKTAPDVKLYLVGSGNGPEDERILRDEAARLGVQDSVMFVGQLPQQEALQYVRDADVCVSPFYPTPILNSTSPTKLVEYMVMGKAVVANDHPEQRLMVDESGAGYCVQYREEPFAEAILRLLNDPAGARSMGEKGRPYIVQHRSYQIIANSVEQKLRQIAAGTA
jgi:glycosyltransferase involved in cell wall biosynthesis